MIIFIQIMKWMQAYWHKKPSLTLPDKHFINSHEALYFHFLNISFIFIENKHLCDLMCDWKREKNVILWHRSNNTNNISLSSHTSPYSFLFSSLYTTQQTDHSQ